MHTATWRRSGTARLPRRHPTADPATVRGTTERAQVFAWYDYLKRELPDVFFLQSDTNYPINFAAQSLSRARRTWCRRSGRYDNFMLPLGNYGRRTIHGERQLTATAIVDQPDCWAFTGAGIFGASYPIAAGCSRTCRACSRSVLTAVDNNGNNLIDEIGEGGSGTSRTFRRTTRTPRPGPRCSTRFWSRASGPWGSVFSRDDFTDREVQDTDGDGLARVRRCLGPAAPVLPLAGALSFGPSARAGDPPGPDDCEHTGTCCRRTRLSTRRRRQRYTAGAVFQERERDPLDPNQQLTAPQWWAQTGVGGQLAANNSSPFTGMAGGRLGRRQRRRAGIRVFLPPAHRADSARRRCGLFWDRGGELRSPGFYSKFLILSGGRDKQPGVFPVLRCRHAARWATTRLPFLIANENNALPFALDVFGGGTAGLHEHGHDPDRYRRRFPSFHERVVGRSDASVELRPSEAAKDDISNHNLQSVSGIGGSG